MQAIDYSPRFKGVCPKCGEIGVSHYSSKPWIRLVKVRYHRCPECGCLFKSTQEDASPVARDLLAEAMNNNENVLEAT